MRKEEYSSIPLQFTITLNLKPRMKLAPYSTGPLHRQALVCRWEASLNLHCFCLPEVLSREERIHCIWAFLPTSDFSSSFAMACICAPSWVWVLCKQVSPGNSCPTKSIGRRKKPAFFSFFFFLFAESISSMEKKKKIYKTIQHNCIWESRLSDKKINKEQINVLFSNVIFPSRKPPRPDANFVFL